MTISTRQTICDMLDALEDGRQYDDWESIYSIYEYVNRMNGRVLYAVFTDERFDDMYNAPNARDIHPLYLDGKVIGRPSEHVAP